MKDEIKEILDKMERLIVYGQYNAYYDLEKQLLDYITNLQEELDGIKDNFKIQLEYDEELENKITNLQEENESLKELCDKYEKEHSTTFNEWKETITDKYQTLKNLQEENEKLKIDRKTMKRWYKLCKSRNEKYEKVINEIKEKIDDYFGYDYENESQARLDTINEINYIIVDLYNGGDEEC